MSVMLWFIVGAIAGSVANAVIYRLPRGKSWVSGRSICPDCKHDLGFWDLIPVLSFLFLGGRCRYCHSPIPIRYLLVELFLGVGFLYLSYLSNLGNFRYLWMAVLWVMTVIAVMDWETMLVHDGMVVLWGILTIILNFKFLILNQIQIFNYLIGIGVGVGVIGGIWILSKKQAMGMGDIGIAAVMGLMLGWSKIWVGLWLAFVIGGIYGAILLITKKAKLKTAVPFGPFLILGTLIAYTIRNGLFFF